MYNFGTEARELEYSASLEVQRKREAAENARRKKRAEEARQMRILKAKAVRTLFIVSAVLAIILIREAQIDRLCGQISTKEKELENLDAIVTEKEMYLSGALDLKMVEETAMSRLGMKKPDQSQYVYIDMDKADKGEVLKETDGKKNAFESFFEKVKRVLEYLY